MTTSTNNEQNKKRSKQTKCSTTPPKSKSAAQKELEDTMQAAGCGAETKGSGEFTPMREPENPTAFDPSCIFYQGSPSRYFVDVKTHFRTYTKEKPVRDGISRYIEEHAEGLPEDSKERARAFKRELNRIQSIIELDQAIDWAGKIAGYPRGIFDYQGRTFLATEGPIIPDSQEGDCPLHLDIIRQAFPHEDGKKVFLGWLRDGVQAVRKSIHHSAPMLVLAGERNAGKSLLAYIVKKCLGGRATNPMTAWSGKLPWNDNILGSELLLIDDSEASTDPRSRRRLGARFKETIYSGDLEINTRSKDAITMRPVSRVMVCCNETPENLSVIPPLEEGIEDKIILIKVRKIVTPMPAKEVDEKKAFRAALHVELPMFLRFLEEQVTPEHLQDSRDGVTAWKDQDLLTALNGISPENKLEQLIALCMDKGHFSLDEGESEFMKAAELQAKLQDRDSPAYSQAGKLLEYHPNCGRYLSALLNSGSPYVTESKKVTGIAQYKITRPSVSLVE